MPAKISCSASPSMLRLQSCLPLKRWGSNIQVLKTWQFYIVQQVSGFFNISDRRRLSRRRTAHLSLLASRSDSSRVRMSPSLTGPCVCYFSQRNHHKRQYEYNKYTNLDVPDDLTVALSNELNLHLKEHNVEAYYIRNKPMFETEKYQQSLCCLSYTRQTRKM